MSHPHFPKKVLMFFGVLFREDLQDFDKLIIELRNFFPGTFTELYQGKLTLTDYYQKEMGPKEKLKRFWFFSEKLFDRDCLVDLKIQSNELEQKFRVSENRTVNLDPGYLALEQVVLATGKPYSHRLYLGKGLYAELTFQYQEKKWKIFPWTYPDYRLELVKNHFEGQRELLKARLK